MFTSNRAAWREGSARYDRHDPRKVYAPRERRRTSLFFGVELELEAANRRPPIDIMNAAEGDTTWAWSSDGSLMNGVELKTMPMTWKYFERNFDFSIFDKLKDCASPMHGPSATAGIHIHMSRNAFTPEQMERFIAFHYANPDVCRLMGGRLSKSNPDRWSSFSLDNERRYSYESGRERCATPERYAHYIAIEGGNNANRYQCLNFHHAGTVELRYFQATTNVNRFKANVQWAHALYTYCAKARRGGLTEKGIRAYIARNPRYADANAVLNGAASHQVLLAREVPRTREILDAPSQPGYDNGNAEAVTVAAPTGGVPAYWRATYV